MARNTSRLMGLDQLHQSAVRATPAPRRRRPANMLEAPDDILDERRYHRRYHARTGERAGSGRQLRENAIMLLVLAASIYGLYELCIYVLNH